MKKIFIANRGEIACRIARTAKKLGIISCGVYTPQDARTRAVRVLDEMRLLPAGDLLKNYLNGALLIRMAKEMGADAVHPGYGFLAENPDFAEQVLQAGLIWIGPNPEAMRKLGGKIAAKEIAAGAGVPVPPWSRLDQQPSSRQIEHLLKEIGLPLLIKATHGGGGRGQRVVRQPAELAEAFRAAQSESYRSFGSKEVFVERFLERPRHVEVQIVADHHGNVVALGERDCTLQRRNQKMIEEAPAVILDEETRQKIWNAAVAVAKAAGYTNAGTVEFLIEDRSFFFLEVNARLQVEHPVTEEIWKVDLVELQIRLAEGAHLHRLLSNVSPAPEGHAMEVRLIAEDPANHFLPTPGPVIEFYAPQGEDIRLETGFEAGDVIAQEYDSLFAKLIVKADTRASAITRLKEVLDRSHVSGFLHNKYFLQKVLDHPDFCENTIYTRWIEEHPDVAAGTGELDADLEYWAQRWRSELFVCRKPSPLLPLLSGNHFQFPQILRDFIPGEKHGQPSPQRLVQVSGSFKTDAEESVYASGWINRFEMCLNFLRSIRGRGQKRFRYAALYEIDEVRGHHGPIVAHVPGVVLDVRAKPNDVVEAQTPILIVEAMKIEMPLTLPVPARIMEITVKQGDRIQPGQTLVIWEPTP